MHNQYILEVKYLDKIRRVKRKTIVGVYPSLDAVEKVKDKMLAEEIKYKLLFSINAHFNPFLEPVA